MRVNIESAAVAREPQLTHNISYTRLPSHGTNENSNNVNVSSSTKSDDRLLTGTDSEMETTEDVAITEGTTDAQVVLPPDGADIASNTVTTPDVADSEILNELDWLSCDDSRQALIINFHHSFCPFGGRGVFVHPYDFHNCSTVRKKQVQELFSILSICIT